MKHGSPFTANPTAATWFWRRSPNTPTIGGQRSSFYGIADFRTLLETTGPWRQVLRAAEYGDPVEHKAFLEEISPLRKVGRIKVPLLIAHGLEDPRVPPSESELLVACMKGLGLEHEIIRVPHAGHGFVRQDHRLTVFPRRGPLPRGPRVTHRPHRMLDDCGYGAPPPLGQRSGRLRDGSSVDI